MPRPWRTDVGEAGTVAQGKKQDVVDVLVEQHEEIKSLFREVASATGVRRQELFQDLVRLLAVHETAEEEVVHPVVRSEVHGSGGVVDARLTEENAAKEALAHLYELGVDHSEFDTRLQALATAVTEHATREETEEFPTLRQQVSSRTPAADGGCPSHCRSRRPDPAPPIGRRVRRRQSPRWSAARGLRPSPRCRTGLARQEPRQLSTARRADSRASAARRLPHRPWPGRNLCP